MLITPSRGFASVNGLNGLISSCMKLSSSKCDQAPIKAPLQAAVLPILALPSHLTSLSCNSPCNVLIALTLGSKEEGGVLILNKKSIET